VEKKISYNLQSAS